MPEAQDLPGAGGPLASPRPRRPHRRTPFLVKHWWIVPLAAFAFLAPWIWTRINTPLFRSEPLPGFIADPGRLADEYRQYTGKPLQDSAALQRFDQATKLMLSGSYANSAIMMEDAARSIAVPAVFNDLGLLYLKINDSPHAVRAFRDALARDHDYPPARANLKKMNLSTAIEPAAAELEPNNSNADANAVWLEHPVAAEISAVGGDLDCFWFTASRPPRDRVSIQVVNRSPALIPQLRVFDAEGALISGLRQATEAGGSVRFDFSPTPNGFYNIQVDGGSGSSGAYLLTVSALHAYDVYEPNDDIMNSTRITLGQPVVANIMDAADTDFYSFVSPTATTLNIDIASRDGTLIPGLTTFASDYRSIGFGPDLDKPGPLHHVLKVDANQVFYNPVWGKNDSSGGYTLVVR